MIIMEGLYNIIIFAKTSKIKTFLPKTKKKNLPQQKYMKYLDKLNTCHQQKFTNKGNKQLTALEN